MERNAKDLKTTEFIDRFGGIAIGPNVRIPRAALRFTFSRSSGPGGQAVNKLSTRAQLRISIASIEGLDTASQDRLRKLAGKRLTNEDAILLEAETFRSQLDNKQACIDRLEGMLKQAMVRPKVRRKKKPTRSMIERRLESKRRVGDKKKMRRSRPD